MCLIVICTCNSEKVNDRADFFSMENVFVCLVFLLNTFLFFKRSNYLPWKNLKVFYYYLTTVPKYFDLDMLLGCFMGVVITLPLPKKFIRT